MRAPSPIVDMTADSRLTSDDHAIPDARRARYTYLRHEQAQRPDPNVVADLHEIVDLGSRADHGIVDASAIDRSVRADLHVISNDAPADVRNLLVSAVPEHIAKAVAPDARARVDEAARADLARPRTP